MSSDFPAPFGPKMAVMPLCSIVSCDTIEEARPLPFKDDIGYPQGKEKVIALPCRLELAI